MSEIADDAEALVKEVTALNLASGSWPNELAEQAAHRKAKEALERFKGTWVVEERRAGANQPGLDVAWGELPDSAWASLASLMPLFCPSFANPSASSMAKNNIRQYSSRSISVLVRRPGWGGSRAARIVSARSQSRPAGLHYCSTAAR